MLAVEKNADHYYCIVNDLFKVKVCEILFLWESIICHISEIIDHESESEVNDH